MNAALTASMTDLPQQLRRTLTWDRDKELSGHAEFAIDTGTHEGVLRRSALALAAALEREHQRPVAQYFPKGTDLSRWSAEDLEAVALAINNRPRKVLTWKTAAEVFAEQLRSPQDPGVASNG